MNNIVEDIRLVHDSFDETCTLQVEFAHNVTYNVELNDSTRVSIVYALRSMADLLEDYE